MTLFFSADSKTRVAVNFFERGGHSIKRSKRRDEQCKSVEVPDRHKALAECW